MPPPLLKNEYYTYADYLTWMDDERWELINGEPYNMSPAPPTAHQRVLIKLISQIGNFLSDGKCEAFPAPFDVRFPKESDAPEDIVDVVQPDISVICDPSKIDEKGCLGAPDFIAEIISPSTAYKDYRNKYLLYEKNGVDEYWLVHPTDEIIHVHVLREDGTYGKATVYGKEDAPEIRSLPGLKIDLSLVFIDRST